MDTLQFLETYVLPFCLRCYFLQRKRYRYEYVARKGSASVKNIIPFGKKQMALNSF
jgi:hypothetical protein